MSRRRGGKGKIIMIKFLHRLSGVLIFAGMIFIGTVMLISASEADAWKTAITPGGISRLTAVMCGLGLLFLAMLYGLTGITRRKEERFLSFDTESGTLSISTLAIADYVSKLAGEFPTILKMKPRVVPDRNTIDVVVYIKIKAGPDIHETCAVLQRRVRESIVTGLGIKDVGNVEVIVKEIVAEANPL